MALTKRRGGAFYNSTVLLSFFLSLYCQFSLIVVVSGTLEAKETSRYTTDPCGATVHGKPVIFLDQEAQYRAGTCDQLSPDVMIAWTLEESTIRFEVHAYTEGWVAIGVNNMAGLLNADMAIGWVNEKGVGHLYDVFNDYEGKVLPIVDDVKNVRLIKSKEKDSVTSLLFSRPLSSGFEQDKDIKGRVWIVWAYGTEDPEEDDIHDLPDHAREGATSIRFLQDVNTTKGAAKEEL